MSQRIQYGKNRLQPSQIEQLESIGIEWNPLEAQWQEGYRHAKMYYEAFGHLKLSTAYICADGFGLGEWVRTKNRQFQKGTLSAERIHKLEMVGMVFDKVVSTPKPKKTSSVQENAGLRV